MVGRHARHAARLGLGVSAFALIGSGQAFAQSQPPCVPTENRYCVITNDGTMGQVTLPSPAQLVNRGTISGNEGAVFTPATLQFNTPTPVMAVIDNRAGATITGTGGTAIRGGAPLTVINAGTINGNVQGAAVYVANGGTLNGNLLLGTGTAQDFGSQMFIQRGDTTGVTGSINAGNGIDFWIRSYAASANVALGAPLPTTFEVEGVEARGAGTRLIITGPSADPVRGLMLAGDGNIVNRANVGLFNTTGANFPPNNTLFTPAIGYAGVPETNASIQFRVVNPANQVTAYTVPVLSALNSFTNDGNVFGDIRLSTASFTNSGTLNFQTRATGTVILTAKDRDFSFSNTGTINYADTGARAGLAAVEAQYLYDENADAALRIYMAVSDVAKDATFDNSGQITGGLAAQLVARNLSFTNTGSIAGMDSANAYADGIRLTIGTTALDDDWENPVLADRVAFLNDTTGSITHGVSIDAFADNFTFENRGMLNGSPSEVRAINIDQYNIVDADGEDVDGASFSFINSGTVGGDTVINVNTLQTSIVNTGSMTMPVVDYGFSPYRTGLETIEVEISTTGASVIDFTNSGSIVQANRAATAVSFEVESNGGSTLGIVNSGEIRADGGATSINGSYAGQSPQNQLIFSSVGMFVETDPTANVRIENREGGLISAYGGMYFQTPTNLTLSTAPAGFNSIALLLDTGAESAVEIVNSGTIQGGGMRTFNPATTSYDMQWDIEESRFGGAITGGSGAETLINTETGLIRGGIALGAGDDRVENYGQILGFTHLGSGNDTYLHLLRNQQFAAVDGGDGEDTLLFDITGSDGIVSDGLLSNFLNFEIRRLVGTGNVVTNEEVTVDDGGSLDLGEASVVTTPGQTAIGGGDGSEAVSNAGTVIGNVALGGGDNAFTNNGSVTGDFTAGDGNNQVANTGTFTGNVTTGNGNNNVSNGGTFTGNVTTGSGADQFTNNGSFTGNVDLGQGGDQYVVGAAIDGTVDGGDGIDEAVFNLGAPAQLTTARTALATARAALTQDVLDLGEYQVLAPPQDAVLLSPDLIGNIVNFELLSVNGPGTVNASGIFNVQTIGLNGANLFVAAGNTLATAGATTIIGSNGIEAVTVEGTVAGGIALSGGADRLDVTGRIGGAVDLGDGNDTLGIGAGAQFDGVVAGGAGSDGIVVAAGGTAATPFELAGTFTGFESYSQAGGVTAISGAFSLGTAGNFALTGGRLIGRAGSTLTGNVAVGSGATFGSAGIVNGNIAVASGGTLSPGASPGVMTVNGNVSLARGSTTEFEFVPAPGQSDQLNINGALTIASGSTLNMTGDRPLTPGVTYNLITASGGITGTFTTVNKAASVAGFLRYTANELQLLGTFVVPTGTSVQTGAAIDYLNSVLVAGTASPSLVAAIPSLLTTQGAPNTALFGQLTAEAYATASQLSVEHGLTLAKTVRGGVATTTSEEAGGFVFGQGIGNWRDLDGNAALGTSEATSESYGFIAGVGYGSDGVSVAAFAGKLDSKQTIRGLGARTDADGLVAGITARIATGGFDLTILAALDRSEAQTSRSVPGGTVRSRYDLHAMILDASAGYSVPVGGDWAVRPEVGITHIATNRSGAVETGSATFGYTIAKADPEATFIDAGLTLEGGLSEGARVKPWVQAGVRHQLNGQLTAATGRFASASGFTVLGASRDETLVTAGAGVTADLGGGVSLGGAYQGEFGGTKSHNVTVGIRFGF